MSKVYLITPEDLASNGFIHGNVEASILNPVIQRVQDNILQYILGTALLNKLKTLVETYNNGSGPTIDEPYLTLYQEYVIPCLVAHCEKKALPYINQRIRNKAVTRANDQYVTASSKAEITDLKQEIESDCTAYENRLVDYLCENGTTLFPNEYIFTQAGTGNVNPKTKRIAKTRNLMFVHGGTKNI